MARPTFLDIVAAVAGSNGKDMLVQIASAQSLDDAVTHLNTFHSAVNARLAGQPMDTITLQHCMSQLDATKPALERLTTLSVPANRPVVKSELGASPEEELQRLRTELAQTVKDRDAVYVSHQTILQAFEKHRRANMEYKTWETKIRQDLTRAVMERDVAIKDRTTAMAMNAELELQHKDLTKRHVDTVTEVTMQRGKLAQAEARYVDLARHLDGLRRQVAALQKQLRTSEETSERRGRRYQDLLLQIRHLQQSRPAPIIITSSGAALGSSTAVQSSAGVPPNPAFQASPTPQFHPPMSPVITSTGDVSVRGTPSSQGPQAPPPNNTPVGSEAPAPVNVPDLGETEGPGDVPPSVPPPGPNADSPLEELAQTQPFLDLMTKAFEQVSGLPKIEYVCTFCRRKALPDAEPVIYPHDTLALMTHCKERHPRVYTFALNLVITES